MRWVASWIEERNSAMTQDQNQTAGSAAFTVALTGHRPARLAGYDMDQPFYRRLAERLARGVDRLLDEHQHLELRSGMALGADQIWAEVALAARATNPGRVAVVGYLPFPGQADKWPAASRAQWARLRAALDDEHVTASGYSVQALYQRNRDMVRGADLLVAVWDGSESGGTAGAVRHARATDVAVSTVVPEDLR